MKLPMKTIHSAFLHSGLNHVLMHAVTKFPWNKTQDTPEFTRLPTDVLYMTQMEKLKIEMNELLKSFELMRSALIADNSRVVKEVCDDYL